MELVLDKNGRSRPKTASETHNNRIGFCCSLKPVCIGRYERSIPGKRPFDEWILDIFIYFLWGSRDILLITKIYDLQPIHLIQQFSRLEIQIQSTMFTNTFLVMAFPETKYFDLTLCVVFCKYFINNWIVRDDNVIGMRKLKFWCFR